MYVYGNVKDHFCVFYFAIGQKCKILLFLRCYCLYLLYSSATCTTVQLKSDIFLECKLKTVPTNF